MGLISLPSGNPMIRVLAAHLGFEVVVFGLAIPGMIQVSGMPVGPAFAAGGGVALLALIAAATLRRGAVGWLLGWLTQVAGIALGLATDMMFWVGGIFAALWLMIFAMGRRLDAARSGRD